MLAKFEKIDDNALDTNAVIAVGNNSQSAWDSHSKTNAGSGSFYGNCHSLNNTNMVNDNVLIDAPINDQDIKAVVIKREKA